MPKMYLMSGPCGAGKTTLSKKLVQELNLRYLSIDNFYTAYFGTNLIHQDEDEVWEGFAAAIKLAEKTNVDILVDTNSPRVADRIWFFDRFPGFDFHFIKVDAPLELCLLNNNNRDRVIPEDEMRKIYNSIEPISERELEVFRSISLYENTNNQEVKLIKKIK